MSKPEDAKISFSASVNTVVRQKKTKDGLWSVLRVISTADVCDIGRIFEVTGIMPAGLTIGDKITCAGVVINDGRFGDKFRASEITIDRPKGFEEVRDHIAAIRGVGRPKATIVVESFREHPDPIVGIMSGLDTLVKIIDPLTAKIIVDGLKNKWEFNEVEKFLGGLGLRAADIKKMIAAMPGQNIISLISANPFVAVPVIGFKKCDVMSEKLQLRRDMPERVDAGVLDMCLQICRRNGHCSIKPDDLLVESQHYLKIGLIDVRTGFDRLLAAGSLVRENTAGSLVFPKSLWSAEVQSAESIVRIMMAERDPLEPGKDDSFIPSEDQNMAIEKILGSRISIMVGPPGSGKTTVIKQIINAAFDHDLKVLLCAPTGKAACKMEASCGHQATTIHRRLGGSDGILTFDMADMIVVDEMSMVGIELFRDMMVRIKSEAIVLLVGDPDQLPSIAPGDVLMDLIKSGEIPVCRLTKNHRQGAGSLIAENILRINRGEMPIMRDRTPEFRMLFYEDATSVVKATGMIVDYLLGIANDKLFDIQVISPINNGDTGTDGLNRELRSKMRRPEDGTITDAPKLGKFSLGDKIIQCENDYERDVINGEIGVIAWDTLTGGLVAQFGAGPGDHNHAAKCESFDEQDQLKYAYAITVHKSQGSEFKYVVLVVTHSAGPLLNRRLIYTGVSRGRDRVIIVGQEAALRCAIDNIHNDVRNTGFASRISDLMKKAVEKKMATLEFIPDNVEPTLETAAGPEPIVHPDDLD